jgi:thiamine-monophosphate kinase
MQLDNASLTNDDIDFLVARLEQPTPRVNIGLALAGIAHSAIDISDGLLSDLGHIVERSNVGASIDISKLPLSSTLQTFSAEQAYEFALTAGDDYELCFTVPQENINQIQALLGQQCTQIGVITEQPDIVLYDAQGAPFNLKKTGYDHFSN